MEEHGWTHPICEICYAIQQPGRMPVAIKPELRDPFEKCCFCGDVTREGIYYRHDPRSIYVSFCPYKAVMNGETYN
jgi:hypothetical protein